MKRLFFGIIFIVLIMATSRTPEAKVTGKCDDCHTMHSSQGVAPSMWIDKGWTQGTTRECLLVGSCYGCHAQNTSANIVTGIPQVRHTDFDDLAAGNFNYIAGTDDDTGHNVAAIDPEGTLTSEPPGDQHGTGITTDLTCAGAYGCHGDRSESNEIESLKGAHHMDDTVLKFGTIDESQQAPTSGSTGTKVGLSYRFLMGVKGGEDSDWQATSGAADHNEYKGAISPGTPGNGTSPANNTISGLCEECHGYFHGTSSAAPTETGSPSPWLRHPTDIVLTSGGEYAEYNTPNTGTTQYSLTAPLARQVIPDPASGSITLGTDVVMCLSCHRAHATNFYKLMRWDNTANMDGCVVCHTRKD